MHNSILLFYLIIVNTMNISIMLPFLLLECISVKWWVSYLISISGLLKYVYNVSTFVKNKEILFELLDDNDKSHSIIIQNHPSQFDFFIPTSFFSVNNKIPNIFPRSIIYYYTFVFLPGFGMISYLHNNILITLNKLQNLKRIDTCKINNNNWLWFYPEGSVYCKSSRDKSYKWCDDNNKVRMNNCLYPRSGAMSIIHKNNNIQTIYSICTQYDSIKVGDKYVSLHNTKLPSKVYFDLSKHCLDNEDITEKTVDIFYDIDKKLCKNIDEKEYVLLNSNYLELFCLIFQVLFFVFNCYLTYSYSFVQIYLISVLSMYYIYLYFDMK